MKVGDLVRYVKKEDRWTRKGYTGSAIGVVVNVGDDPLRNNKSSARIHWMNDSWSVENQRILEVIA